MTTIGPQESRLRDAGGHRIAYVIPTPMQLTSLGVQEIDRRAEKLRQWCAVGSEVSVHTLNTGPASIESMYEEYLAIPHIADVVSQLALDGYDAAVIGCFGDPGLDGLREITDMFVAGPASSSIALATTLGHRFSIVTVTSSIVPALRRLTWELGSLDALASIRHIETSVLEVNRDHDAALKGLLVEARRAIDDDGADSLVLGCMSMGFLDVAEYMTQELGVPVINPVKAGLKFAETTLSLGLSHSRHAYERPPKMVSGLSRSQLLLGEKG